MSLWGRNKGMWASYQIQQNQNRSIYADHVIQQERITQGCQTINKSNNIASVNSGSVLTALKEGSQDYTCTEKAECLIRNRCPVPTPIAPPPYTPGPGQAIWSNMVSVTPNTSLSSSSFRSAYTDTSGNVYVTGFVNYDTLSIYPIYDYITTENNTVILKESTTVPPISTTGTSSLILIKYNSNGIAQWAVNFDEIGVSNGVGIITDNLGNIYITGLFSVSTNPLFIYQMDNGFRTLYGTYTPSSNTGFDVIVMKYTSSGSAEYVSLCGNVPSINDQNATFGLNITLDPSGYIAYTFYSNGAINIYNGTQPISPGGPITFGPSELFTQLTLEGSQMGVLVRARTTDLQIQQATRITLTGPAGSSIITTSIVNDLNGNIIVTGYSSSTATGVRTIRLYDTTPTILWGSYTSGLTTSGNTSDVFIAKYNNLLSPQSFTVVSSSTANEQGRGIITDSLGNIYLIINKSIVAATFFNFVGRTGTTINLSTFTTYSGDISAVIIKYNTNLQIIDNSITTITLTNIPDGIQPVSPNPSGICIDSQDNVYISINFTGTLTINNAVSVSSGNPIITSPYASVKNITPILSSLNYSNGLIIKYNSQLQAQWATTIDSGIVTATIISNIDYDPTTNTLFATGNFINYNGYLNINNYNGISGGTVITELYGKLIPNTIGLSGVQTSGFIIKYVA